MIITFDGFIYSLVCCTVDVKSPFYGAGNAAIISLFSTPKTNGFSFNLHGSSDGFLKRWWCRGVRELAGVSRAIADPVHSLQLGPRVWKYRHVLCLSFSLSLSFLFLPLVIFLLLLSLSSPISLSRFPPPLSRFLSLFTSHSLYMPCRVTVTSDDDTVKL